MRAHLYKDHKLQQFKSKNLEENTLKHELDILFAKFIISTASTFSIINNKYLIQLSNKLNFKLLSSDDVDSVIVECFYSAKTNLIKEFSLIGHFSMTTDVWAAKEQKANYINLTVHYLNNCFRIINNSLGIHLCPKAHDYTVIINLTF